jgi:hypothetical protein
MHFEKGARIGNHTSKLFDSLARELASPLQLLILIFSEEIDPGIVGGYVTFRVSFTVLIVLPLNFGALDYATTKRARAVKPGSRHTPLPTHPFLHDRSDTSFR